MTTYTIKKFGKGKGNHVFYMVLENGLPIVGTKCDFYSFARKMAKRYQTK